MHQGNKVIDKLTIEEINGMKVQQYRILLKKRDLSEKGIHKELKARLTEWHQEYHAAQAAAMRAKVEEAFKTLFEVGGRMSRRKKI